ncbi:MAG: hypothetical protein FJW69_08170 [Actinobacteria bacterium]|nr:hypothetical protein [Actinomycetota bacterium]
MEPRLQTRLVTRLAPRVTSPVAFPVIAKTGEKKPKEPKEEVSPAYQLFVRRKGKWIKLGKPTVKGIALKKGSEFAQRTLGASFKVEPTKAKIKAEEIPYVPSPKVFRKPKVKGKTELKSPIFIQRGGKEPTFVKGARLAAPSEKAELKLSRRKIKWR